MTNKIFKLVIIWGAIIVAYIIMGAAMPALNSMVQTANATLVASSNMSNYPGTQEAVTTAPIWLWAIPGGVGVISSVVILKKEN